MRLFFTDATYMANRSLEHGPFYPYLFSYLLFFIYFLLFYSRSLQIVGGQFEQLGKGLE